MSAPEVQPAPAADANEQLWNLGRRCLMEGHAELRVVVEGLRTQLADALSQQTQDWETNRTLGAQVAAVKALADEAWTFRTAPDLGDAVRAALESGLG